MWSRTIPPAFGEESPVYFGPLSRKFDIVTLDPLKSTFSGYNISALRGCWLLTFLHALAIDQGLLAHIPNGDGSTKIV